MVGSGGRGGRGNLARLGPNLTALSVFQHQEEVALDDADFPQSVEEGDLCNEASSQQLDVSEALFQILAREDTFNRHTLKRRLCPGMRDVDFGLAFHRATERARDELHRVFKPQQGIEGGLYVLANARDRLNRGNNHMRAANRKMIRAVRTIAIPGSPDDVETERQRTSLLERMSFQMARRAVESDTPLPNLPVSRERPARPPVVPEISGYPTVPPRSRY